MKRHSNTRRKTRKIMLLLSETVLVSWGRCRVRGQVTRTNYFESAEPPATQSRYKSRIQAMKLSRQEIRNSPSCNLSNNNLCASLVVLTATSRTMSVRVKNYLANSSNFARGDRNLLTSCFVRRSQPQLASELRAHITAWHLIW
jgi:hypothetical protein